MPAAAVARRAPAPARRRPAASRRRTAPRRNAAQPPRGQLIPLAVGRTAVAVRDLPDSGLVVRMARGRLWIGVLATLLAGIVAVNVLSLSLSSSSSAVSQQMTALERRNSELRARIDEQVSNERVQAAAAQLGLEVPAPGDITYLDIGSGDATRAARLLASGGDSSSALAAVPTSSVQPTASATALSSAPRATPAPAATSTKAPAPTQAAPASSTTHAGGIAPG
jgi:cell division protein FtsB